MADENRKGSMLFLTLFFTILTMVIVSNMEFFNAQPGGKVAVFILGLTILMFALDAIPKFELTPFNILITSVELLIAVSLMLLVAIGISPIEIATYLAVVFVGMLLLLGFFVLMGREISETVKVFYMNVLVVLIFLAVPYWLNKDFLWLMYNELLPLTAVMFLIAGTNRLQDAVKIIGGVLKWLKEG